MIIKLIIELVAVALIIAACILAYKKSKKGGRPLPYLLGFILCVGLAAFTSVKIIKTYMRRGALAGAYSVTRTVTQKWDETYIKYDSYGILPRGLRVAKEKHAYWISWGDRNIKERGDHRLDLPYDVWSRLNIGDSVQVLYNKGDSTPYYAGDERTDDVMFDFLLLAGESFGAIYMMRKILAIGRRLPDESGGVIHLFK